MKFLPFLLFLMATSAFGQITGVVRSVSGEPVAYATIVLYQLPDSALISGISSGPDGAFTLSELRTGRLGLRITSIGYQAFYTTPVTIQSPDQELKLLDIFLQESTESLEEIVVTGQAEWIEETASGKVINVQNSLLTKGSTALQVLERLPGVITDRRNGQFSLNGQSGVTILINGRRVQMSMNELMVLLENTLADNVEKIELITSPTAQYDADGGAGVINIVMKNAEEEGSKVNLSLTGGYGYREKAATSVGFARRFRKSSLYTSYSFMHDVSWSGYHGHGTSNNPNIGGVSEGIFSGYFEDHRNTHNLIIASEFHPSRLMTFGMDFSTLFIDNSNRVHLRSIWDVTNGEYVDLHALSTGDNAGYNLLASGYWKLNISDKTSLNMDVSYVGYRNDNPTAINSQYFDREGNEIDPENELFTEGNRGKSNSSIDAEVLKIDYSSSLNNLLSMDFGVKGSYARNNNDSRVERLVEGEWEVDSRSQNEVFSDEVIGAAYTQLQYQWSEKHQLQAGVRYEYWKREIDGNQRSTFRIAKFFPSLKQTFMLREHDTFTVSYYRRISRPAYTDLVSNVFYADPTFIFSGNPQLKPAITDVAKVDFLISGFSFGLSAQNEQHPILRYQITTNEAQDIGISSPQNLDYQRSVNLYWTLPIQLLAWWRVSVSAATALRRYKVSYSMEPVENTFVFQSVNFSQTIQLPMAMEMELSGWYNFPFDEGTNSVDGFGVINFGLAKTLDKEWGTLQLTLPDLLRTFSVNTHLGAVAPLPFEIHNVSQWQAESALYQVVKLTYSLTLGGNAQHVSRATEESQRLGQ